MRRCACRFGPLGGLFALVALGALAFGVMAPAPSQAMTKAPTVAPTPWIALVIAHQPPPDERDPQGCTGTVVGNGWVLTAAHCVHAKTGGKRLPASKILVELNRRNFHDPSDRGGIRHRVDRVVVMPGYPRLKANDAALLHLTGFDSTRWSAVPIAHEPRIANGAAGVTLYGYGDYLWLNAKDSGGESVLRKSPQGAFRRDPRCDTAFSCFRATGATRAMHGDSGGPFLRWVSGAWQIVGVAANVKDLRRDGASNPIFAVGPFNAQAPSKPLGEWVRSVAGLPRPGANTIVRNPANGNSWLVGADGYRRWIPTGGDWLCLVGRGSPVQNLDQLSIDSIPDRVGTHARCANPVAASPTPPPPPPPAPTPPSSPAPTPTPKVTLAKGPAGPVGFRYAITLSGWPAGARVSVSCRDSVDPGGFFTFTMTTDASGRAFTQSQCYSADGPDHWVVAGGRESNHVTWTVAPPPPPPPPPATWPETTGGAANTWTNYLNAGGTQGPTIAARQTVQIACKVTGFRVASGNTWWYRIAQSPWSNRFYVSADAFYNNGATSGSLVGTPFVDTRVPNC